jgi:hypothetical protein
MSDLTRSDSDLSVANLSLLVCYAVHIREYLPVSMAQCPEDLNLQLRRCEKCTSQPRSS